MSAAVAQQCTVCQASLSKYKCPTCKSPTCSLVCAKQHAGERHSAASNTDASAQASTSYNKNASSSSSSSSSSSRSATARQTEGLPPLKLRDETVEAPPSHRFEKVGKYVSMKEYNASQMLEDFEYLQYIGKCVGKVGSEIVKNGWLREMEDRAAASAAKAAAAGGNSPHHSLHNQRGNMHRGGERGGGRGSSTGSGQSGNNRQQYQNIPAEVKNRQAFESLIRRMKLPIMLLPDGMSSRKENQTRWKNNTKQILCTVEVRPAGVSSLTTTRNLFNHIPWDREISSVVVKDLEKRIKSSGIDTQDELVSLLLKATSSSSDDDDYMTSRLPTTWRDSFCITISLANDRLRNESSSKFLEWWQRQVKNGMVKADGLQLDEEKRTALEEMRRGVWGAIEGMEVAVGEEQAAAVQGAATATAEKAKIMEDQHAMVEADNVGLISASFLSRLQAARARKGEQEEEAAASKSHQEQQTQPLPSFGPKRQLLIIEGAETFQDVLQSLPKGIAILEFFHIEIWARKALLQQIESGNILRENLQGREEETIESLKRPLPADESDQAALPVQQRKKKSKTEPSASKALSNLTAYASSSEGEEEDEEEVGEGKEADNSGLGEEDNKDEGELPSISATLSGLAEIARSLGMVPSE